MVLSSARGTPLHRFYLPTLLSSPSLISIRALLWTGSRTGHTLQDAWQDTGQHAGRDAGHDAGQDAGHDYSLGMLLMH